MASALTLSHIEAERRLRLLVRGHVGRIWRSLPGYDRANVDQWLSQVLPLIQAGQRQSIALTEGYLARALGRRPFGLDPDEIAGRVRNGTPLEEAYQRPFVTLWSALGEGKMFADASSAALARAEGMSAFDIQGAMARTAQAVGSADREIQRFQRVADGEACAFCQEVDGAVLNSDDVMPLHNNCVVGATRVWTSSRALSPSGVEPPTADLSGAQAITRRWYSGELVAIETTGGRKLTVTPNHPVLTGHGWVAAGLLREGDNVVSHTGRGGIDLGVPDENDMPARIEDRFRAATMAPVSVPFSSEHFHGDIGDGEVDVVAPNGDLHSRSLAALLEPPQQAFFGRGLRHRSRRASLCPLHNFAFAHMTATHGVMGRGRSRPSLIRSLARGTDPVLLRSRALGHARQAEVAVDRSPRDAEALGEGKHRLAGEIALDRIAQARRVDGGCHVFNLVTNRGWYIANGVFTHNCGCSVEPLTESVSITSTPDTVAIADHGELGPLLVDPADHFTTEAQALG